MILVGGLSLSVSSNAFAKEHRIDCMSKDKNIHVGVIGSDEVFSKVKTLVILDDRMGGESRRIENPGCVVLPRDSGKGLFVIVRCEKQNLLINQFLQNADLGAGLLMEGAKAIHLDCATNGNPTSID